MAKIHTDDEVIVIAGKDKGRRGKVLRIVSDRKLLIGGVNMVKKHVRPNPQRGVQGGIVEQEAAIEISNIAIFNKTSEKADRVAYKILDDGKKVRVYRSTQEQIDA